MISSWRPRSGPISTVARTAVVVAAILGFMGRTSVVFAQTPDVVITTTGDKLIGEIIRVEKDVLTFSTGYSDADFKIEWDKVASIESSRQFVVETFDGKRLSGSLVTDPNTKAAVQIAGTSVPLTQVSALQPVERNFWSRFDSGLDFGYSMTRTNSASQLSLGSNLSYRDVNYYDALSCPPLLVTEAYPRASPRLQSSPSSVPQNPPHASKTACDSNPPATAASPRICFGARRTRERRNTDGSAETPLSDPRTRSASGTSAT